MTIKLVRTDSTFPSKVELLGGKHVFGREKLLDCNDKRISRQHGQLIVNDESVTLTALHQNPCFFQKKESKESEILKINNTIVLHNGDKFGLLPNIYWYEIIVCMDNNIEQNDDTENDTEDLVLDNNAGKETISGESIINYNLDDNLDTSKRPDSPSLLSNTGELSVQDKNEPLDQRNEPEVNVSNELQESNTQMLSHENIESNKGAEVTKNSPSKRCLSPDNVDAKKIKIEHVMKPETTVKVEQTIKAETSEENLDPDAKPGCSTNQMNPAKDNKNIEEPVPAPARPRERCMYGAQCYRRNPTHLSQFSHPQDGDWGPGERGVCPYGASCRRKNVKHWRDHEHPPGTLPPPPDQGMRVVQRFGNIFYINAHSVNFYDDHFEAVDTDGPRRQKLPDRNILFEDLPLKRVRKMVQRQDWDDSESDLDHDPFATDESDEWEPESSGTLYSEEFL